jgi:hypothetical protein
VVFDIRVHLCQSQFRGAPQAPFDVAAYCLRICRTGVLVYLAIGFMVRMSRGAALP